MLMGWQGKLYVGTAGSTAATLVEEAKDVTYNVDTEVGDTTVRGNGASLPIKTGESVALVPDLSFTMIHKNGDAVLNILLTAAYAGAPLACRTISKTSGKGFDGDVILSVEHGEPIGGEQTYSFKLKAVSRALRAAQLFV